MIVTLLHWQRYAALGDAGPWATRLAGILQGTARLRGDEFEYADLAQSPGLMHDVVSSQIPRAIDMSADLVSLLVGGGDLADPATDPDTLARRSAHRYVAGTVRKRRSRIWLSKLRLASSSPTP